jgi:hypothetical protein
MKSVIADIHGWYDCVLTILVGCTTQSPRTGWNQCQHMGSRQDPHRRSEANRDRAFLFRRELMLYSLFGIMNLTSYLPTAIHVLLQSPHHGRPDPTRARRRTGPRLAHEAGDRRQAPCRVVGYRKGSALRFLKLPFSRPSSTVVSPRRPNGFAPGDLATSGDKPWETAGDVARLQAHVHSRSSGTSCVAMRRP